MAHNGNNGGWFAVSRSIFDHYVVGIHDRPYTELEAWLWLLSEAAFEETKTVNKGQPIVIDPGQLMAAHAYLAKVWDWTPDKVRWYLKRLQNEAMITRWCATQGTNRNTNQIQILTICNYGNYQVSKEPPHQAKHQPKHQANTKPIPSQHHEYKEDNLTTDKKNTPPTPQGGRVDFADVDKAFEEWWAVYPVSERKVGKGECKLLFREAVTGVKRSEHAKPRKVATHGQVTVAEILEAVHRYADYVRGKDVKLPAPATWLNQARWLDLREQAGVSGDVWWMDPSRVAAVTLDRWRAGIADNANGKWPIDTLGPPPGHPLCVVPNALVTELRLAEKYNLFGGPR